MTSKDTLVGALRWLVTLAKRDDIPGGPLGTTETYTDYLTCHANILPIGTAMFLQGVEIGQNVTHRVLINWFDRIGEFTYVFRHTTRPDGTTKSERYKILRIADLDGRRRYTVLDVQEERIGT